MWTRALAARRIYVTAPSVEKHSHFRRQQLISDTTFTVNNLSIDLSGASEADLDIGARNGS